jgi:hypothetical protein
VLAAQLFELHSHFIDTDHHGANTPLAHRHQF